MSRLFLVLVLLATTACARERVIQGTVRDFETDEPLAGARVTTVQHGWGFQDGSLVWDKDKSTITATAEDGSFQASYRWSSGVKLRVQAHGYQRFETSYGRESQPSIRLKRRVDQARAHPQGLLRLGVRRDGTLYGWDFSEGEMVSSPGEADLLPTRVGDGARDPIELSAPGGGGILFLSRSQLGVDDLVLVFTDTAPEVGYGPTATLDFTSEGGVFFVRTRDGHYAKFAFDPSAFAQTLGPEVVRDLSLFYVYNPDGSRDLLYQLPE